MRVNMSDVKVFILKQKNTSYDVNSFLCGSTSVWSAGLPPTDNSYFTFTLLEDDTYSIKAADIDNMPEITVLPSKYKGKAVTKIEDMAFHNGDLLGDFKSSKFRTVVIPSSIKTIGNGAFFGSTELKTIVFSEGCQLTTIGEGAFMSCALSGFAIPSSVTSIGVEAFFYCRYMTWAYIPSSATSIGEKAFDECNQLAIYCEAESQPSGWDAGWNPDNLPVYWGYNPDGADYLTFTEMEDGTYSVKATDVNNMPSFLQIPLVHNGKAVTVIEGNAFYNAKTVEVVDIPASVTTIGANAFRNCKTITSVSIAPNSLTSIGENAFNSCTSLTEITLPSTVTEIGSGAFFYCTALATIVIPSSVTTIGDDAFAECSALSINCEAASQPSGWTEYWNSSNRPVTWGYTG